MHHVTGKRFCRLISILLAVLIFTLSIPTFAFGNTFAQSEQAETVLPENEDMTESLDEGGNDENEGSAYIADTAQDKSARKVSDLLDTVNHKAYMSGYENNAFKPYNNITRAETAQIFYNLLKDKSIRKMDFKDVARDKWYADAIGAMGTLGIISGYEDGTFRPDKNITRAEFVKMATAFDTLLPSASSPFSDVSSDKWYYRYVATAYAKGWINGYTETTFAPDAPIRRAEAAAVINRMTGRSAPSNIKSLKDACPFYDVFPDFWGYQNILEAAVTHDHTGSYGSEVWTSYKKHTVKQKTGWVTSGSDKYYFESSLGKFFRGDKTIGGKTYYFDELTAKALTGFRTVGAYKRYYRDGLLVDDISNLGVVSGPYFIKVYKQSNYLIIFAKDSAGSYNIPVKAMLVSCGYTTPTGTFYTPARYRWLRMMGDTYAQWCTQIEGNYLFHSVPNWTHNNFDLEVEEYNNLGNTRSLGCIRLNSKNAKWIFDNCVLGTRVYISPDETGGPLAKPTGIWIPDWHTWDPTDPTAYWKCQQTGCH